MPFNGFNTDVSPRGLLQTIGSKVCDGGYRIGSGISVGVVVDARQLAERYAAAPSLVSSR